MHAKKGTDDVSAMYGQAPERLGSGKKASLATTKLGAKVVQQLTQAKSKAKVDSHEDGQVWYRSGWVTQSPKARMKFVLRPLQTDAELEEDPVDAFRLSIYGALLSEAMSPKMYDLSMTGVDYSISISNSGISFLFTGFTPLMPRLIDETMMHFDEGFNITRDVKRYQRIIEEYNQSLHDYSDMPVSYAIRDRDSLLTPGSRSREESIEALAKVTPESVASSVSELLLARPLLPSGLAMGNLASKDADGALGKILERSETWKGSSVEASKDQKVQTVTPVVKLSSPIELRKLNPRPGDGNDVVVVSIVSGLVSIESRVVLGILSQIVSSTAYTQLRTNMQLGYVVSAGQTRTSNVQSMSCVVQGDAMGADEMEAAVEHVLTSLMPEKLNNITDKDFESYKASFTEGITTPPTDYSEEFSNFWVPISEGGQCFDVRKNMLHYVGGAAVTKEALVKTWNELLLPESGERQKLVVKYFANKVPARPSEKEAAKLWKKHEVPTSAADMLRREYGKTQVIEKADMATRKELADKSGYFPTDLGCELEKSAEAATTSLLQTRKMVQHQSFLVPS
jgi:secreted Zn-dependent insulinase-like peptidase